MGGLYRRLQAAQKAQGAQIEQSPLDGQSAPGLQEQGPSAGLELHKELAAEGATGISFDEQIEIIGQINEVIQRSRIEIKPDTFSFTPKKSGNFIPILINVGAAAVTLIGAFLFLYFFNLKERSLVTQSAVILTAEGKLIQALKKESEEQLSEKDREITQIQGKLDSLARERDKLKLETQAQIQKREAELKAALEKELAAERQKLQREGLGSAAIEQQLKALQSRLADENQRQMEAFRKQTEAALAAKDASLAALAQQYSESLKSFQQERSAMEEKLRAREAELAAQGQQKAAAESERTRMADQLAQLRDQRQKEQLVFDQVLSSYEKVMGAWKNTQYEEALKNLDSVKELLARDSVISLPAVQQRLPVERFVIDSMRRLIETERSAAQGAGQKERSQADAMLAAVAKTVAEADRRAQAGNSAEALRLYEEAIAQVPDLKRSYAYLADSGRKDAEKEKQKSLESQRKLQEELARYQAEEKKRLAAEAELRSLRERYGAAAAGAKGASGSSQEKVLALLETKLRVRQVISSEPVRSQYPGLYDQLEEYFAAYGREQRQEGQATVLQDAITLIEGLLQKDGKTDLRKLKGEYAGPLGDLFSRLLEKLQALLQ